MHPFTFISYMITQQIIDQQLTIRYNLFSLFVSIKKYPDTISPELIHEIKVYLSKQILLLQIYYRKQGFNSILNGDPSSIEYNVETTLKLIEDIVNEDFDFTSTDLDQRYFGNSLKNLLLKFYEKLKEALC